MMANNAGASCLFCRIASGKISAFAIYEDAYSMAFLDIQPRIEGHTVVVPKFHAATIADLPDSDIGPFFTGVKRAAKIVSGALLADGLTIGINQGGVSGQTIDHLHVHIFPRFANDGGGSVHSVVHVPSTRTLEEVYGQITKFIVQK